ncbi:hypothetical protein E3A20_03420, partial [Planctomyces bekefii]
ESSRCIGRRIYSELKKHFPTQDVFLDHDSIPLGKPFLDVIRERLATSKFALVLIGPQWCSIKDEKTGQRRLDDPNDFVRLEVETALATPGVDVILLWVMRATTTNEEIATLPASLQPLFKNNGMSLRPVPDESNDLLRLIGRLSKQADGASSAVGPKSPVQPRIDIRGDFTDGGLSFIAHRYRWKEVLEDALSGRGYRKFDCHVIGERGRSVLRYWNIAESLLEDIRQAVENALAPLGITFKLHEFAKKPSSDGLPTIEIGLGTDFTGAVDALAVDAPEDERELISQLTASYPGDREKAARALGHIGPKAANAVPALGKLLKDASGPVRNAAAFALRAIGTEDALAVLAKYERR